MKKFFMLLILLSTSLFSNGVDKVVDVPIPPEDLAVGLNELEEARIAEKRALEQEMEDEINAQIEADTLADIEADPVLAGGEQE